MTETAQILLFKDNWYTCYLDTSEPQFSDYYEFDHCAHEICIPKINSDSSNATSFNNKIINSFKPVYDDVVNHTETCINRIEYIYTCKDDIIGIIAVLCEGVLESEWWFTYFAYYYDLNSDKELLYNEYLRKLNITEDDVWNWFIKTDKYKEETDYGFLPDKIWSCITDDTGTYMILTDEFEINYEMYY